MSLALWDQHVSVFHVGKTTFSTDPSKRLFPLYSRSVWVEHNICCDGLKTCKSSRNITMDGNGCEHKDGEIQLQRQYKKRTGFRKIGLSLPLILLMSSSQNAVLY